MLECIWSKNDYAADGWLPLNATNIARVFTRPRIAERRSQKEVPNIRDWWRKTNIKSLCMSTPKWILNDLHLEVWDSIFNFNLPSRWNTNLTLVFRDGLGPVHPKNVGLRGVGLRRALFRLQGLAARVSASRNGWERPIYLEPIWHTFW